MSIDSLVLNGEQQLELSRIASSLQSPPVGYVFEAEVITHLLASQLWGVSVTDPWTFASVVVCVLVVGLAACLCQPAVLLKSIR